MLTLHGEPWLRLRLGRNNDCGVSHSEYCCKERTLVQYTKSNQFSGPIHSVLPKTEYVKDGSKSFQERNLATCIRNLKKKKKIYFLWPNNPTSRSKMIQNVAKEGNRNIINEFIIITKQSKNNWKQPYGLTFWLWLCKL